jgi:tyrosine-protein kinase
MQSVPTSLAHALEQPRGYSGANVISSYGAGPSAVEGRPSDQPSLRRYVGIIRRRIWVVVLAVVLCTGAAALYVFLAQPVYEADADMLVTPLPVDQAGVLGLGLIRQSSDPTRDVTTAARLIDNVEVARRVARDLRLTAAPQSLLGKVTVEPVAQSSIVSITARSGTPRGAQRLANGFGAAVVAVRTEQLHRELDPAIAELQQRIKQIAQSDVGGANSADAVALGQDLASLETLRSGADPTLRLETPAALPTGPVSPRSKLAVIAGVLAGLLLGVAGAFALTALDPRGEREDRLRDLGVPVLANVPDQRRSHGSRHAFEEAFRFLRTMIRFAATDQSRPYRTIAITSASEQEGKTTTAYQLAFAALEAGQSVLLVEADPYRPGLRHIVDVSDDDRGAGDPDAPGLLDYLSGSATLDEVIQPTAVPGLRFVASGSLAIESITGLLEREHGRGFVRELAYDADLVILDCPPIGPRSDAVLIAAEADGVLLVVDLNRSTEKDITDAVRRLRSARSELLGVVLNRDESGAAEYAYHKPETNGSSGGLRRQLRRAASRSA